MDNKKLFDDDENEDGLELRTNKNYAKHYNEFRKKEILSHRELDWNLIAFYWYHTKNIHSFL